MQVKHFNWMKKYYILFTLTSVLNYNYSIALQAEQNKCDIMLHKMFNLFIQLLKCDVLSAQIVSAGLHYICKDTKYGIVQVLLTSFYCTFGQKYNRSTREIFHTVHMYIFCSNNKSLVVILNSSRPPSLLETKKLVIFHE